MSANKKLLWAMATTALLLVPTIAIAEEPAGSDAPKVAPVVTTQDIQTQDANDPFEGGNRVMFDINQVLDEVLLRPVAVVYRAVLPDFAQDGVRNFMNNLNSPVIFANDVLQGEGDRAGTTLLRFGINSTIGVGGLFDVAKEFDLPYHDEDFGQTLGTWGAGEGPYFYFLVMGPSNVRDFTGFVVDRGLDPLTYVNWGDDDLEYVPLGRTVLNVIDLRARNIDTLDEIERASVDYYASIRSLYRQSRADAIRNGAPSTDLPDFESGGGISSPSPISQNSGAE
ncbi:MAG: VacJ family lipoprotein [Alphaproteobacteria bacterium]|nr:VacJ family lipoprotein [Alphaproteobacteria bacterium]